MFHLSKRVRVSARYSKIHKRVETLLRKAAELSDTKVEVLVVVRADNRWYEFSSVDATALFFGLQSAKESLDDVEIWDERQISVFPEVRDASSSTHKANKLVNSAFLSLNSSLSTCTSEELLHKNKYVDGFASNSCVEQTPTSKKPCKELPDLPLSSPDESLNILIDPYRACKVE